MDGYGVVLGEARERSRGRRWALEDVECINVCTSIYIREDIC
jgi:hypothetical protein